MAIKVGQSEPLRRNYVVGKADKAKRSIAGAGAGDDEGEAGIRNSF